MKRFRGIVIVVLLIGAWLTIERGLYRRAVTPANVTDLDSFLDWRPDTGRFTVLAGSGGEHLMATGPGGGVLPSGSAGYVFDRSGKLVDWSSDIGDDSRFDERWQAQHSSGSGRSLSRSEVSGWRTGASRPGG